MGVRRIVTIVCDGPCKKEIQSEHVPEDWSRTSIEAFEWLEKGQKPTGLRYTGVMCPQCTVLYLEAVAKAGIRLYLKRGYKEVTNEVGTGGQENSKDALREAGGVSGSLHRPRSGR